MLSQEEQQALTKLTNGLLSHTLGNYEALLHEHAGQIDTAQWKLIKRRQHMNLYQARATGSPRTRSQDRSNALLWFGTIEGSLNDVMYGIVNPTTESMKLKSSFVADHIVDSAVLASIEEATPSNPFKGVHLKWCVHGGKTMLLRPTTHYRDFAYVEATGVTRTCMGERVGYHIVQTIEIPGIRTLKEYKCERGNLSLYHLFRQKDDNTVEVYVQAVVDSSAAVVLSESVVSLKYASALSEMKKLNWLSETMVTKKKTVRMNSWNVKRRTCCVCQQPLARKFEASTSCSVCFGGMCRQCRVTRRLSHHNHRTFCVQCVYTAVHTDGMIVAADELYTHNQRTDTCDFESITDSQGACLEVVSYM